MTQKPLAQAPDPSTARDHADSVSPETRPPETRPPETRPSESGPQGSRPSASRRTDAAKKTTPRLTWRKKLIFALATTLAALLLVEGGLWLFGVRPVIATEDPYLGFTSLSPLFEETPGDDGDVVMQTAANKRKYFNLQKFPRDKPAGAYRIFCLGGSTTFGRPYDDLTSFCGFLREFLPAADPSRRWEVINCGGISYASYREALLVEEACRYEPDLFIFYGSQNEFLEARTYHSVIETPPMVRGLGSLASHTRLYAAAHWAVQSARGEPQGERDELADEVKTRLDRSVGPVDYHRDDEERKQIVEHYRFNLTRMIDTARANGADVLLVAPASNLRDCSPFKSEHAAEVAADDKKLAAYQQAYDEAKTRLDAAKKLADAVSKLNLKAKPADEASDAAASKDAKTPDAKTPNAKAADKSEAKDADAEGSTQKDVAATETDAKATRQDIDKGAAAIYGELNEAKAAIDRAVAIDPLYAAGHYLRGRILDELNLPDEARESYQRALEEDVCPLRAVHEITDVIEQVADDRDADWIDYAQIMADASPQGITDFTWFLDHVHPSPGGHQLLAQAIVDRLIKKEVVRDTGAWNDETKQEVAGKVIGRIDKEAHAKALRNLSKVLEWAGKHEEATSLASEAARLSPTDAESYFLAATGAAAQGQLERALKLYELCLQADPGSPVTYNAAGGLYEQNGQFEMALSYYRKAVQFAEQRNERRIGAQARVLVGGALMKLDKLDEAEQELRAAIAADPNFAEAYNRLGLLYRRKHQPDEALAMFVAAERIEPRNASFLRNEGGLLLETGKFEEAKRALAKALSIEPGDAQTHATLADAHLQLKEFNSAEAAYRQALRIAPRFGAAKHNLALILMDQGRLDEADKLLADAEEPEALVATMRLVWRLATDPDDAVRDGARAVELGERARKLIGDRWARSLDILAAAYAEAGRFDDAVKTADLAVAAATEAKDDQLVKAARQRLEGYRKGRPYRDPSLSAPDGATKRQ